MADNSLQTGSDSIRDIDRSGAGPKTQVFQLDHGGSGASESLTSATNPLPSYGPDITASGTLAAAAQTVVIAPTGGFSVLRIQITGTWVGTLGFEATVDGTNWISVNAVQAGSTVIPQSTTTNGVFSPTPAGFASFRVNMTAWTSGSAVVTIRGSRGHGGTYLNQALPSFSVIPAFKIDQTTPGTTNLVQISGTVPVSLSSTTLTGTSAVSLATLPALTAGAAVIGAVTQSGTWNVGTITTLPALATGANVIGGVTQSGTWNIGSITTLPALATGANVIGALTANQSVNNAQIGGVAPLMGNGVTGTGSQRVTIASDNTPFTVNATPTTPTASIITSAATTNATSIKASAGTLYSITCSNAGAAAVFVKLYNLATAPTVGTSSISLTIPIAASGVVTIPLGSMGMRFGTGIALAITNLVGEADATAVAANQVKVLISYI